MASQPPEVQAALNPEIPDEDEIKICVKTISNDTYDLNVTRAMLISVLKSRIKDTVGVDAERQRLIYRGKVLQDQDMLSKYKIQDGHTVHMVARPLNLPISPMSNSGMSSSSSPLGGDNLTGTAGGLSAGGLSQNLSTLTAMLGLGLDGSMGGTTGIGGGGANGASIATARRLMMGAISVPPSNGSIRAGDANRAAGGRTPAAAPVAPPNLEHVRQGLLTMYSMMATNDIPEHDENISQQSSLHTYSARESRARCGAEEMSPGSGGGSPRNDDEDDDFEECKCALDDVASKSVDAAQKCAFFTGQWLDAKDTVNQWLEATVMDVNAERAEILIHYNGWPTRWDEWMPFKSGRIAPFRSRTVHSVHSPFVSPSPVSVVANAPSTGDEDVRIVLPEVNRMMLRVTPIMQQLQWLCDEQLELDSWRDDDKDQGPNDDSERFSDASDGNTGAAEDSSSTNSSPSRRSSSETSGPSSSSSQPSQPTVTRQKRGTSGAMPWASNALCEAGCLKHRRRPVPGEKGSSDESDPDDVRSQVVDDVKAAALKRFNELKEGEEERKKRMADMGSIVAPLIDRLGRLLADTAPHLQKIKGPGETDEETTETTPERRPRSPSPTSTFRQLISSPARSSSFHTPPSTGNIDIHIHAILTPLRGATPVTANQGQGSTDATGIVTPSTAAPNTTSNTGPGTSSTTSASGATASSVASSSDVPSGVGSGSATQNSPNTNMNSVNTTNTENSPVVSGNTSVLASGHSETTSSVAQNYAGQAEAQQGSASASQIAVSRSEDAAAEPLEDGDQMDQAAATGQGSSNSLGGSLMTLLRRMSRPSASGYR
uniref:Ubiquitin-like domain-containing protein n=1 Tax=Octactis speculum TaxID=3111310 RepID=A0A7S2GNI3_9STRA